MTTFREQVLGYFKRIRKYLPDEVVNYCYHLPKAVLAVLWYRYPARDLTVIAVTGTDGKTTTTNIIFHILNKAGLNTAMVSTVKAVIGDKEYDTGLHITNPDAWQLQGLIRKARDFGAQYLVLEVTSHGLMQYRNFGTNISIAVITNISHEHLDYHKTMHNYVQAKAKILHGVKYSILNRDDRNFRTLLNKSNGRVYTFSLKKEADFNLKKFPLRTKLYGQYNKANCLAAIAAVKTLGIDDEVIKKAIFSFPGVSGRMEEVKNKLGVRLFIDFAHKPNALKNVLETAGNISQKKGRVIIIFGSAGLRDVTKRPVMGEIAGKLADIAVLTGEDPRTENVNKIINQIARGASRAGACEFTPRNFRSVMKNNKNSHFLVKIPDRARAINFAVNKLSRKKDVLLFCGKGHEKSMCFGTTEYPWNEKQEILKAVAKNEK